jgi:hypothetical protein
MSEETEKSGQLEEPSVLDYFKSLFHFGNGKRIQIPAEKETLIEKPVQERHAFLTETPVLQPIEDVQQDLSFVEAPSTEVQPSLERVQPEPPPPFPWRSLLAFLLAWVGQAGFEPPHTTVTYGIALYIAAFAVLALALRHGEWKLPALAPAFEKTDPLTYRSLPLIL